MQEWPYASSMMTLDEASSLGPVAFGAGVALLGTLIGSLATFVTTWWKDRSDRRTKLQEALRAVYVEFIDKSRQLFQVVWNHHANRPFFGSSTLQQDLFDRVEALNVQIEMMEVDPNARSCAVAMVNATRVESLKDVPGTAEMPLSIHSTFFKPMDSLIAILRKRYGVQHD